MKNMLLFLFSIGLIFTSCQTKRKVEKEKEAIIKVIEESTNAYKAREIKRLDSIYLHDETTTRLNAGRHDFVYRKGWEEIRTAYKEMFEAHPLAITTKYEKTDFTIKVYRKSAYAFHDEVIYDSEYEYQHHQIGVHFLEKVKGEWKIVFLSYIDSSSYEEETGDEE
jgi:hypothetical protein